METKSELMPLNCSQKSFYSKAYFIDDDTTNKITLYSYDTPICIYDKDKDTIQDLKYINDYKDSNTTRKHIREFAKQRGYHFYVKDWEHIYVKI